MRELESTLPDGYFIVKYQIDISNQYTSTGQPDKARMPHLRTFPEHLEELGLAPKTIYQLSRIIDRFIALFGEPPFPKCKDFLSSLEPANRNKHIKALKHYAKFCGVAWELPKILPEPHHNRPTFADGEITRILGIQNAYSLYFQVLAHSGCRPGELAILQRKDIDFSIGCIAIYAPKTKRSRLIPLPESIMAILETTKDPLFPWSDTAIRNELKKRCNSLGVVYRPPYAFRHSFAGRLLDGDANLLDVSRLLGHSSIDTTSIYYSQTVSRFKKALQHDSLTIGNLPPETRLKLFANLVETLAENYQIPINLVKKTKKLTLSTRLY